jgi:signal transduction histidine kinase
LLEVYDGVRGPTGERFLFETYQPFSSIAASGRRIWLRFLPALAGALLLLELVQLPLAYLLARRLRERQRERSALLERTLDASEAERRRIAGDLHDGPVQDLAGVAFSLAAAAERLNGAEPEVRGTVEDAARRARATVRELRTTLVDLYPASLRRSGLQAPVSDLLGRLRADGVEAECDIPADLVLPDATEALLFRVVRESLANVRKHANAGRVEVRISVAHGRAALTVADDGRGFDVARELDRAGRHFGLRLLSDLVAESGGRLTIDSAPGGGTRVHAEVPA